MAKVKVGIDLAPIGFRQRAPGTAVHVEGQVRALLDTSVEWDWVLVATPRTLDEAPFFRQFDPIIVSDKPLTWHVSIRLGRIWRRANCSLGLATAFFCPFFGPPVVTNYFDANFLHPVRDDDSLTGRLKWHVIQILHKFSRKHSRALFIDSNYARSEMIRFDPESSAKWVVAPCGCPELPAPSATPSWAQQLNSKGFILYVGAFSENKNQRRLIEAWDVARRRHDSFPPLVLIGPCSSEYLHQVILPARKKVVQPDEVIIPGFISDDELSWAFTAARAYVQPSFAEGFGMPVIQAMNFGIPVACSNSTSLPEIAGPAALLFDPSDVGDIARVLENLVFDESKRADLKRMGAERAQLFSWRHNANIVIDGIRRELAQIDLAQHPLT